MKRPLFFLLSFFMAFANALPVRAKNVFEVSPQTLRPAPVASAAVIPAPPRGEVPIYQTTLSDGTVRYSIPVRIGRSQPIQAMLDTGSTGLRILVDAIPASNYSLSSQTNTYGYGSGVKIVGTVASADFAIGGTATSASMPIQIIQRVGCLKNRPACPASRVTQGAYRLGGDGIANEGFKAIIGVAMPLPGKRYPIVNPLLNLGYKDWIVKLPLPGQPRPGMLIVNPDAEDLQGFTSFTKLVQMPLFGTQTIAGCLHNLDIGKRFCGPIILDTGTASVTVNTSLVTPRVWGQGMRGALSFGNLSGWMPLKADFTVSDGSPGCSVIVQPPVGPRPTIINAGIVPFFSFAVSYDADKDSIGLKPRQNTGSTLYGATQP
jgi:hypothetical protein